MKTTLIDDYDKAMELMRKMEAHLPIPARPTSALARLMREKGVQLAHDQELEIQGVFYISDAGGISCDVTSTQVAKEAIVVSLTQLRVHPKHPLVREIRAYQRKRTKRLARAKRSGGVYRT